MPTIPQLTEASTAELTEDGYLVFSTEDGATRKVKVEDFKNTLFCPTLCARVEVSNAELLDLMDNPKEIVAAAGAGTALQIIGAFINYTYDTAVFASSTTPYLGTENSYDDGWECDQVLEATSDTMQYFTQVGNTWNNGQGLIENEAIVLGTPAANPTLGGGTAVIYCIYRIVTL